MLMVPNHPNNDAGQRGRLAGFLTSPIGGLLVLISLLSAPLVAGAVSWMVLELAPAMLRLAG
jgi:hypothetical protein